MKFLARIASSLSEHPSIGGGLALTNLLLLFGCGPAPEVESPAGIRVILQTDWHAQPEHGGFYQALVKGYYAEEGLDVEIRPGGPNANTVQRVVLGEAHFSLGRSDEVIVGASRGLPVVMVGALMQKDPQALMFHASSGISGFEDLDGRPIMAVPGLAFLEILQRTYGIDFPVIPTDYGMDRFLADKGFVQQVFVTSEPFYVRQQGADPKVLLLADSGFNPYRVWYTSRSFIRNHPDVVAAFTRASIRGWRDYIEGDPTEANAMIAARNPRMTDEFMAFGRETMIERQLVTGEGGDPAKIGLIEAERVAEQIEQLAEIGVLENPPALKVVFDASFLPADLVRTAARAGIPSIALAPASASAEDLLVELPDGARGFLSREALARIRTETLRAPLEVSARPRMLEVVSLDRLIRALGVDPDTHVVTVECSDGYWSIYEPDMFARNEPFLVLQIDQQTVSQWAGESGRPDWGPYLIQTSSSAGLLDPPHKNPWGVQSLTIRSATEFISLLRERIPLSRAPSEQGLAIFLNSCASCHALDRVNLGGTVSNSTATILAVHAALNENYLRDMLRDPEATNPAASKMPAYTHYSNEQISAVLSFLQELHAAEQN